MIICKTPREIEIMREAGRIVALTHQELKQHITPGITTKELDQIAEKTIQKYGATPSFKGYNGFPGSICASVNEELVHGIPGSASSKRAISSVSILVRNTMGTMAILHGRIQLETFLNLFKSYLMSQKNRCILV